MTKPSQASQSPCILVIFGATGDLTARKLIPALYHLYKDLVGTKLPYREFVCVGVARRPKTHETFRNEQEKKVNKFSRSGAVDPTIWREFATRLFYHTTEFSDKEAYTLLGNYLDSLDNQYGTSGNRIYYLATQPEYFPVIIRNLCESDMLSNRGDPCFRVVIEKPFGRDLVSSKALQKELLKYLDEKQIYRIDHYLGKESIQNILHFIFPNRILARSWNSKDIDSIQITIAEDIGIETRGHFFETEGILRDIVQNHIMQLLALITMEPPKDLTPSSIQKAKIRALKSIRPLTEEMCKNHVIRGQYRSGTIKGKRVPGYREEQDVDPHSNIETYVAMKLFLDNRRWKGVPFYIRVGKRLSKRIAEITIIYKPGHYYSEIGAKENQLSMRIQPNEGFNILLNYKILNIPLLSQVIGLDFSVEKYFKTQPREAYESLLLDCICGIRSSFISEKELMESWRILTPLLQFWEKHPPHFPNYDAGTWGPQAAADLLKKDGREWIVV